MPRRFWVYIATIILLSGMVVYYQYQKAKIDRQAQDSEKQFQTEQASQLQIFLDKQNDPIKLVRIAKNFSSINPDFTKLAILKAHELSPNSRDITLLASSYDSSLTEKLKTLDPLYKN